MYIIAGNQEPGQRLGLPLMALFLSSFYANHLTLSFFYLLLPDTQRCSLHMSIVRAFNKDSSCAGKGQSLI